MKQHSFKTPAQGFSLLESLVALLLISVGILGIANMQFHGLANNNSAYYRSIAVGLVSDMSERLRINADVASAGGYSTSVSMTDGLATADVAGWLADVQSLLPVGGGTLTYTAGAAGGEYAVAVTWNNPRSATPESISVVVFP
jgi:type IV pilus assembly protein PilV